MPEFRRVENPTVFNRIGQKKTLDNLQEPATLLAVGLAPCRISLPVLSFVFPTGLPETDSSRMARNVIRHPAGCYPTAMSSINS